MRKFLRTAVAAAALSTAALAASSSAMAAGPTGDYARFSHCPYTTPGVFACVIDTTTSGSFKLGNANVPITAATPITLQGGISTFLTPADQTFYPPVGVDALSKTKLKVPGGLLGLMDTGGFPGLLVSLFNSAVASVNDVYATAELVGPVRFNVTNTLAGSGTAIALPVRVHLENPFLGSSCYIGSAGNPVQMNLTTGTTAPPPPTTPITGGLGTVSFTDGANLGTFAGITLVDNASPAPAASNCGFLPLDKLLITAAVNLKEGLPAAAGKNSVTLTGDNYLGTATAVAASVH